MRCIRIDLHPFPCTHLSIFSLFNTNTLPNIYKKYVLVRTQRLWARPPPPSPPVYAMCAHLSRLSSPPPPPPPCVRTLWLTPYDIYIYIYIYVFWFWYSRCSYDKCWISLLNNIWWQYEYQIIMVEKKKIAKYLYASIHLHES